MSLEKIPFELREVSQWVCWKEIRKGNGKPTKVPLTPNGESASTTNFETWRTFDECAAAAKKFSGVGFVFTVDDDFCGIDLDGCRNPETGEVSEWAREIVKRFDSYSEVSPSMTGVKIFIHGCVPAGGGKKIQLDFPPVGGKHPAIEVYDQGRYFAVTGIRLGGVSTRIESRQGVLENVLNDYAIQTEKPTTTFVYRPSEHYSENAVVERAIAYVQKMPPSIEGQGGHNALFKATCKVVLGFGLSGGSAMQVLQAFNQLCSPPWSERELLHKIKQAEKQPGDRNYLRNVPQQHWESVNVPDYELPESEKVDRKRSTITKAAESYIQYITTSRGELLKTGVEALDYSLAGGIDFGEVVVLAGRPSHGKSAVALQMLHKFTRNGVPCLFVSEEMSERAIGKRLLQFISEFPEDDWTRNPDSLKKDIEYYAEDRAECFIVENCVSVQNVVAEIERHVDENGVRVVVVDYAQLLEGKGRDSRERVSNTSKELARVARRLNIVLILLAQISRDIEKRPLFIPTMGDLKESGQLEQDADVILFGVWPYRIDHRQPKEDYQIYVSKNRNREIRKPLLRLRFNGLRQMVVEEELRSVNSFDELSQ